MLIVVYSDARAGSKPARARASGGSGVGDGPGSPFGSLRTPPGPHVAGLFDAIEVAGGASDQESVGAVEEPPDAGLAGPGLRREVGRGWAEQPKSLLQ